MEPEILKRLPLEKVEIVPDLGGIKIQHRYYDAFVDAFQRSKSEIEPEWIHIAIQYFVGGFGDEKFDPDDYSDDAVSEVRATLERDLAELKLKLVELEKQIDDIKEIERVLSLAD